MSDSNDQLLTELADAAFKQAAKKVIRRAIETGTPVILWDGDSVKKVDPKTITQPVKTN